MKKYVQNIDRLFAGQTASALVLSQVDEDFPVLIPSLKGDEDIQSFVRRWAKIYPDFNPTMTQKRECLNQYIVEFNLSLQQRFKDNAHAELYMMDDTSMLKPDDRTFDLDKTYMHTLNGKTEVKGDDGEMDLVNLSQLNVLFPWKKTMNKSLYSSQLKLNSAREKDDIAESHRLISLQAKVSKEKCLQAASQVGNNLYAMSSEVPIHQGKTFYTNSQTVMNGILNVLPNSISLYQPSQDQYLQSSIEEFRKWYENHNRRTIVYAGGQMDGTNVSYFNIVGPASYEISLAAYCPSSMELMDGDRQSSIPLTIDKFRSIRAGEDSENSFIDSKTFVLGDGESRNIGFKFNLYDTFITGQDRILKTTIPVDKDFNNLTFRFDYSVEFSGLQPYLEVAIYANGECVIDQKIGMNQSISGEHSIRLDDMARLPKDVEILVRMHYDVDFNKRSNEKVYQQLLKDAGVTISNIRVENDFGICEDNLTFGSYVNEPGISEKEHERRYKQFWEISKYISDTSYQSVLELPLNNTTAAGIKYLNNYSTGDTYGDMFLTKSVLNPDYDMKLSFKKFNERFWTDDGKDILTFDGRSYIDVQNCSNQLTLVYQPIDILLCDEPIEEIDSSASSYSSLTSSSHIHPIPPDPPSPDPGKKKDDVYSPWNATTTMRVISKDILKYQMVETVRNINRFESSIKHKPNVFSVVVENSNLAEDNSESRDEALENYKKQLRNSVTQFVRNACKDIVPVHTQLFDVQFT